MTMLRRKTIGDTPHKDINVIANKIQQHIERITCHRQAGCAWCTSQKSVKVVIK